MKLITQDPQTLKLNQIQQLHPYSREAMTQQQRKYLQKVKNRISAQRHRCSQKQLKLALQQQNKKLKEQISVLKQKLKNCKCATQNKEEQVDWQIYSQLNDTDSRIGSVASLILFLGISILICYSQISNSSFKSQSKALMVDLNRVGVYQDKINISAIKIQYPPLAKISPQAQTFRVGNFLAQINKNKSNCLRQFYNNSNSPAQLQQRDLLICRQPNLIRNITGVVNQNRQQARRILAQPVLTLNRKMQLIFRSNQTELVTMLDDRFYRPKYKSQQRLFKVLVQILDITVLQAMQCSY